MRNAQARPIASIVMPAHNEAAVIGRSLAALTADAEAGELEIIVVCNGCSDDTAQVARRYAPAVQVIEVDRPSKSNALNVGDEAAKVFPRIYMDADIALSCADVRALIAPLVEGRALAAAPRAELVYRPGASWGVRAWHRFWMALPYIREGMMTAGVYAVSEKGRSRFGRFPDVINDDGYFRLQFARGERVEVAQAVSRVWTPGNLADLVRTRTRTRLGLQQLKRLYPDLFARETRSKDYAGALRWLLTRPDLWIAAAPYLVVNLMARARAARMAKAGPYRWERDESSRVAATVGSAE